MYNCIKIEPSCRQMLVCSFSICYTEPMEILLKTEQNTIEKKLNIEKGTTLAELVGRIGSHPYRILLARVNGIDTELTETVKEGDIIEFLDMRTQSANLVYQRGLTMLYLAAVRDICGTAGEDDVKVEIDNSLNKGFYTRIPGCEAVSEETVERISARMHKLAEMDLPVIKETFSQTDAVKIWKESGYSEKAELLEHAKLSAGAALFYRIDIPSQEGTVPYRNYFFGPMVPSLGYLEYFELRSYRGGILLRFPYYSRPDVIPPYVDDNKLFEAFEEEHEWLDLLHTQHLADMNRAIAEGRAKDMILLSEALHEKKIAEIADQIKQRGKRIILIAGPSSSGKTTFARRLCVQLRVNGLQPLYLGTDDYFVDRDETPLDENGEKNYENLNALDIDLFSQDMNDLLAGEAVDIPEFDFKEGVKVFGKRITKIDSSQPIVIEGIHALNDALTEQISDDEKYRIYISPLTQLNIDMHNRVPTSDARMLRRMVRDDKYRGYPPEVTIKEWPKVRAGEDKNIFPYNGRADVMFNSTLAYETCLLKKYAEPLLEGVSRDDPGYSEAQRLLGFIRFFSEIDDEDDVPNNSILREFIGGSVFVE